MSGFGCVHHALYRPRWVELCRLTRAVERPLSLPITEILPFRFREEFRTLASVRKSPKNEPAVQGMSYGDLRFEAASGGGVLTASSVVKAGL
jgi:hypothetical protein